MDAPSFRPMESWTTVILILLSFSVHCTAWSPKVPPARLLSSPSFPSTAVSPQEILEYHHQYRDSLIATGQKLPLTYPIHFLPLHLLATYFLLPLPSTHSGTFLSRLYTNLYEHCRFPIFLAICLGSGYVIEYTTSGMVTTEYGIGIIWVWTVIWAAGLMIFEDKRKEAKRIEPRVTAETEKPKKRNASNDGVVRASAREGTSLDQQLDKVTPQNELPEETDWVLQPLPRSFLHRFDWTLDLLMAFRGPGWTFQVSSIPGPPSQIQNSLSSTSRPVPKFPSPPSARPPSRRSFLRLTLFRFSYTILALDILKYITLRDPYFWSLPRHTTPSPYPLPYLSRLLISVAFTYFSLTAIFLLLPLFTQLLGPRILHYHADPWLYPPFFGTGKEVWEKGLAGAWGGWWHQLFRHGFETWGNGAATIFETTVGGAAVAGGGGREGRGSWGKRTQRGKLLRTFTAFALSACIHAAASYTTLGPTADPLGGATRFFMLQPIGIIAQMLSRSHAKSHLRHLKLSERQAGILGGVTNVVTVFLWFLWCGPWVADDFAAGGIWLYEPLPVSVLRGVSGGGWWRWGGHWVSWHEGRRWWESGIAIG